MLLALGDTLFEVSVQVGLALTQMQDEAPAALDRDEVLGIAHHEPTVGRASWSELHRGLAHTFTILGLVLEREPLSIAYRAMRSDDPRCAAPRTSTSRWSCRRACATS